MIGCARHILVAQLTSCQTFPTRTEGSVKKHWYKDMHYAEFAEDEVLPCRSVSFCHRYAGGTHKQDANDVSFCFQSQALLNAIKEYENNKWKTIGQKVGKPAKVSNMASTYCVGLVSAVAPVLTLCSQACEQYAKEHFPDLFSTPKPR